MSDHNQIVKVFHWSIIWCNRIFLPNLVRWRIHLWNLILMISHGVWIKVRSSPPELSGSLSLEGGDVEGGSPAKWWEWQSVVPKSTMTQKWKIFDLITQTLGKLACTEHTPIQCKAISQANKGRICELLNEVGMSHPGEAWVYHTQQVEVRNQL